MLMLPAFFIGFPLYYLKRRCARPSPVCGGVRREEGYVEVGEWWEAWDRGGMGRLDSDRMSRADLHLDQIPHQMPFDLEQILAPDSIRCQTRCGTLELTPSL